MQNNNVVQLFPASPNYLADFLELHCLSAREFAKVVGICHSYISKICKNKHRPHPRTRKLLAMGMQRIDGQDWILHAQKLK